MRLQGRQLPSPPVLVLSTLVVFLLLIAVVGQTVGSSTADAETAAVAASNPASGGEDRRKAEPSPPPPPPPAAGPGWSGHAFDACRAPSQRVMDRWKVASPFTGVGIYLGGIHRACEQRHLSARWVTNQVRAGWKLLPIWVGPQASCTGYDHRIDGKPGKNRQYDGARARGVREARRAAATASSLRLPRGEVIFYDIEPFDTRNVRCRGSSLAFLEEWTNEIHRRGYRSGVYSHVNSGISLLSRTPRGYTRPDAVWYAWIDRVGSMPSRYVADPAFMRTSRVHQYALDTRVEFGGIRMDIDWNFVSLGATRRASVPASCDQAAARVRPETLTRGARGSLVRVVQCLALPGGPHPVKASGRYDAATVRAVRRHQQLRGLSATGVVDRRTWTSLLAHGRTPVLRKGARGEPVQRLQRSLNVALGASKVRVDGAYGPSTARVVKHYRRQLNLGDKDVVTPRVWKALNKGKVFPARARR